MMVLFLISAVLNKSRNVALFCVSSPSVCRIKTEKLRNSRNKISPTCEVVHETKESSLHRSPTDSCLAQLSEQGTDNPEVVGLNTLGAIFDEIYFVLCNLTEMPIMKTSNFTFKNQIYETPKQQRNSYRPRRILSVERRGGWQREPPSSGPPPPSRT